MDGGPLGPKLAEVNLELAALRPRPFLHFLDLHPHFLDSEGNASLEFMQPDRVHLNSAGYEHWAGLMAPLLNELMGPGPRDGKSTN
jgi:lysophospholipase L1-like esterase